MTIATRIAAITAVLSYASAAAGNSAFTQTVSVPALSEIGLGALIAGVGIVGGLLIRGRGKKK